MGKVVDFRHNLVREVKSYGFRHAGAMYSVALHYSYMSTMCYAKCLAGTPVPAHLLVYNEVKQEIV